MDCGPTCLRMVAKHYGKELQAQKLRDLCNIHREGVSLLGISEAAEKLGIKTLAVKMPLAKLISDAPLPCILHWNQNHFVVLYKISNSKFYIADPAHDKTLKYTNAEITKAWCADADEGIALLLEPTQDFYAIDNDDKQANTWAALWQHARQHKKYFFQLILGLIVASVLQLIFPFLTQSIVDTGINTHNLQFIYIILIAQSMLLVSKLIVEFIRSRLLLFISTRINISLVTNFWYKLMKLPLSYFDTKLVGDIQQRLQDQNRIESFLTGSSISVFFSFFNLIIFSAVLLMYSVPVFMVFCAGSIVYIVWVRVFLKYRRQLNFKQFTLASQENTSTNQLIYGMQEIKLHNAEKLFRWSWEHIQAKLFRLSFKSLSLSQYQQAGALFINETKNVIITFMVAKCVLDGQLTLGAMLAIQGILAQLNSPIEQFIGFMQQYQDAKISIERLNEIQTMPDEENSESEFTTHVPNNKSIQLNNVSFAYAGAGTEPVLKNINLHIPQHKVTAIVGMSGSGKTTLLKLLLKFYENYSGDIALGNTATEIENEFAKIATFDNSTKFGTQSIKFKAVSPSFWRSRCGSVMQDGYIFNDSIAKNIAVGDANPNINKILHACVCANILEFVQSLPLGLNTKIGAEGNGISQGQKQRILIARAIYKNPDYLFFDEATNALDANNEKVIMENMQQIFKGKTVLVVAHRLSTVKNADNIIVLHNGSIAEEGTHDELVKKRGEYFELVRNQLELGN
jgi:ATP-binding cassette, subfamily B, bacterial